MKNFEFYSFGHRNPMVRRYALRGILDERGSYRPEQLLQVQHKVYKDWLDTMKAYLTGFECPFYEWMLREADTAFVVKEGELVKYKGRYCVVRRKFDPDWVNAWRVVGDVVQEVRRPNPMRSLSLEYPDGSVHHFNAEDEGLEPADIPPEVFALACGRAKDCPMMKGE